MTNLRMHIIVYVVFVVSILFDSATTILCFQTVGLTETNPIYQIVGGWAFPIVYLIDAGFLLTIDWLRKYTKYAPIILFIFIFFYFKAGVTNLQFMF